ncbi:MAG TPA: hypothetical protein VEV16_13310, partial [Daejeonella sp.]|nr:hypothetical protein [Daejeonella sp.]
IPQIQYENASIGQSRIICYPLDLEGWQLKVSKIYDETLETNEVMKITQDINLQSKFNIYAFFVEKKELITESDLEGKATHPKFPCIVTVYKKENAKWFLLKKERVIDWNEYSDLIFKTATAGKY